MSTVPEAETVPAVRFKRRKITHPKRVYAPEEYTTAPDPQTPSIEAPIAGVASSPQDAREEEEAVPNLKEVLRARKRPRDRQKDVARKAEVPKMELVQVEPPQEGHGHYSSRFIAQTGQVVDRDDNQM
jgi:hypothetical protein